MAINKKLFTQADLNGTNQLVYTHNLNNQDLTPALFDDTGRQFNTADIFSYGDASGNNKDNIITLSLGGAISNTWKLLLTYQSSGESGSGRRAFELSENNDPDNAMRLLIGKADTPSVNITLSNFFTLLMSKLGFLKKALNLSDVENKAACLNNLGVYDKTTIDNALTGKASLYQNFSGSAIGSNNTAVYKGSATYHPAVMRDVRNLGDKTLLAGNVTSGGSVGNTYFRNTNLISTFTAAKLGGNGLYRITHNYGSTSYVVAGSTTGSSASTMYFGRVEKSSNFFDVNMGNDSSGDDTAFDFIMFGFNTYVAD